jgi:hypothetical protein
VIAHTENITTAGPSFQSYIRKARAARRVQPIERTCASCAYTATPFYESPCVLCDGKKKWKRKP